MSVLEGDVDDLKIKSIIGFDGTTLAGVRKHPNGIHILYPIGNKVAILNWETKGQDFLSGHTNIISAIDVSPSGKYVASGQINHIGFKALVIIWNFEKRSILTQHEVHKVRVEAVSFTNGDRFLISLGGRDCSSIIVWDLERNKPLCGTAASKGTQGEATVICITHRREMCFVTGGEGTLALWCINYEARDLIGVDINVSKLKRTVICMQMDTKDETLYCGTTTGDILKIKLNFHHDAEILEPKARPVMRSCFTRINDNPNAKSPVHLYANGVQQILIVDKKILLVGAGDGTLTLVEEEDEPVAVAQKIKCPTQAQLRVLRATTVHSMVTSLNLSEKYKALVGTLACEIFQICLHTFEKQLIITCHTSTIYDLAFPHKFSDVFATASKDDVRIWNVKTMQELLRIKVANFCCSGVCFTHDGKAILTGWNDGVIRSFTPLTGRLIYEILNAHNKGVSALAITDDDSMIVSGGCEGQVRLWEITPHHQSIICTLKEHKGPISAVHINKFNDEAVTASTDGTCIIWDIVRKCRKQILFANTLFMCVRYYPNAVQILTGGSDRKIAYWEVLDGSMIRELEGSTASGINALDISPDGNMFITGGNDQLIKLWKYNEGITTHVGVGHSGVLTAIKFSPNGKIIVSTSSSGSIFVWDNPFAVEDKTEIKIEEENKKNDEKPKEKVKKNKEENVSDLTSPKKEEKKKKLEESCACKKGKLCKCVCKKKNK